MKMITLCALTTVALGVSSCSKAPHDYGGAKKHWSKVHEFLEHLRDPANSTRDESVGLSSVTLPFLIEPHLAALVALGEIEHRDVVLPTVPRTREATAHWMRFCDEHRAGIIWGTGSLDYGTASHPREEQPMHFNIWFRPEAESLVSQLITELEQEFGIKKPTGDKPDKNT